MKANLLTEASTVISQVSHKDARDTREGTLRHQDEASTGHQRTLLDNSGMTLGTLTVWEPAAQNPPNAP